MVSRGLGGVWDYRARVTVLTQVRGGRRPTWSATLCPCYETILAPERDPGHRPLTCGGLSCTGTQSHLDISLAHFFAVSYTLLQSTASFSECTRQRFPWPTGAVITALLVPSPPQLDGDPLGTSPA